MTKPKRVPEPLAATIDADWIKWILLDKPDPVLRQGKLPPRERREVAATALSAMREAVSYNRGTGKAHREHSSRVVEALDTLIEALPLLEQEVREMDEVLTAEYVPGVSLMADKLAAVDDMRKAIARNEAALRFLHLMQVRPQPAEEWRQLALAIAEVFGELMQRQDGFSSDGPVARFVFAVIPYITGEDARSPPNVYQQLQRMRREAKQEKIA